MIVDTAALSAWLDGDPLLKQTLENAEHLFLASIALGEYRFGILSSRHRNDYEERLRSLEGEFHTFSTDAGTARHFADIRHALKKKGRPIPWHDVWIAAIARQHNLPVLSRDSHFDQVPGVRRVGW